MNRGEYFPCGDNGRSRTPTSKLTQLDFYGRRNSTGLPTSHLANSPDIHAQPFSVKRKSQISQSLERLNTQDAISLEIRSQLDLAKEEMSVLQAEYEQKL